MVAFGNDIDDRTCTLQFVAEDLNEEEWFDKARAAMARGAKIKIEIKTTEETGCQLLLTFTDFKVAASDE
jgi:uncharacterized protein YfcZ (UPF0381/DUF406 family)